ncbi:MAG: HAD-IIB family hydrolase [Verrucomicrobiales bacterium]|nr:HAD-IIB family hydrolase [Verrucomicrobiales bacterium]
MFLFSTDIDGTIYDGPETAERFSEFWQRLRDSGTPPVLCYNTGRSLADTRDLISRTSLPEPDYIIAGVGTEMFHFGQEAMIPEWGDELSGGWDFEIVKTIVLESGVDIEMQPPECQNPFKCSWFFFEKEPSEIEALGLAIAEAGVQAQLVYSSNRDLDILPCGANKGNAIGWLADKLGTPTENVLVAGDSGNDASMFDLKNASGIVVSNAEPALFAAIAERHFRATDPCADGVIEGITLRIETLHPDFFQPG